MTTVICSEPVTIDLEMSGATLQVQTDSLVVYCGSHKVEEGSGR
jgi:hypothetical protein